MRGGPEMLLRNLKSPDGRFIDLLIEDGAIAAIGEVGTLQSEGEELNRNGRLRYPGLVDAHAHNVQSLLGLGWYRNEVGPTIEEMIGNERRLRMERGIDSHEQSTRVAQAMIAAGTTHVRTFVDIDTEIGLSGFDGVMRTRDDL